MSEGNAAPMPQYQSIKKVWALEIASVEYFPHGPPTLIFQETMYAPKVVQPDVFARYTPVAGDFFVVYEDGYQSISPRKAFVEGYVKI